MEYNVHSVQSHFWQQTYLTALRSGHPDPAAVADEAFVALDCRFNVPTAEGTLCGDSGAMAAQQMAQHIPQFGSNACSSLNTGAAGYAASVDRDYTTDELVQREKLDFLAGQDPSSIEVDPTALDELYTRLTADEQKLATAQHFIAGIVNPAEGEPHRRGLQPTPHSADELFLQANEIPTTTPSVVVSDPPVQDPSTKGLQSEEPKTDDEVLG